MKLAGIAASAAVVGALFAAVAATAQVHQHGAAAAGGSAATAAYEAASAKMHEAMAIAYTGDADADFVAAMIPHHRGAVDMARVVLEYGKDPEIRRLAEAIVAAQESEIRAMVNWQGGRMHE